jgi:hypothetical protein
MNLVERIAKFFLLPGPITERNAGGLLASKPANGRDGKSAIPKLGCRVRGQCQLRRRSGRGIESGKIGDQSDLSCFLLFASFSSYCFMSTQSGDLSCCRRSMRYRLTGRLVLFERQVFVDPKQLI